MIYNSYVDRLNSIVEKSKRKGLNESLERQLWPNLDAMSERNRKLVSEQRAFNSTMQLSFPSLENLGGSDRLKDAKLGVHPDFRDLKNSDKVEYHYIVSVFIDILGSTNLHKEYDLEDIYVITNTIQSAAIHTCIALGGHVQRLQGDGVFAYFGGKSIDEIRAVEMAVTACSMFSYFVENDLKKIFLAGEIENICTRIGIDFGNEKDVMWANFGLLDVSELTTNSLHTSLASKMQAWATKNGIVVGQNVKDKLKVDNSLFDTVTDAGGNTKKFIFENPNKNFKYAQYSFDWKKFIKTLPYVSASANGDLFLEDPIEKEKRRQAELRSIAIKVNSGNAYLNTQGMMNDHGDGVQHQPHRFHYGK